MELCDGPERVGNLGAATAEIRATYMRREEHGSWPYNPQPLQLGDDVKLESINFSAPLAAFYRTA